MMSNLKPLTSDESRFVANKIITALQLLPRHRHNKPEARENCGNCQAQDKLIQGFKTFKLVGNKDGMSR